MTNSEFKIAVIGECMAELSGKPFTPMTQNFGGDVLNTAIYLKKLMQDDVEVSFVTAMGMDPLSQALVEKWREYDINTGLVQTFEDKHVGLYLIQTDEDGERTFQYWRNDSAAKYIMQSSNTEKLFDSLKSYDAVFLSGISLAILEELNRLSLIDWLHTLKAAGVSIVFDGNYREKLWPVESEAKAAYDALYKLSDLVLVTFDDEQALWKDSDITACQQRLSKYGIPELVIKDGANGCLHIEQQLEMKVATTPVETVIDTTAAGDSFNAGFLTGWLQNQGAEPSCRLGNQLAGQVIQQKGAIVDVDLTKLSL